MNTDLFQSCGHCWVFQICCAALSHHHLYWAPITVKQYGWNTCNMDWTFSVVGKSPFVFECAGRAWSWRDQEWILSLFLRVWLRSHLLPKTGSCEFSLPGPRASHISQTKPFACMCVCSVMCLTLCNPMDPMRPPEYSLPHSSVHGDSPAKNTGVGCHFLLQVIFLTQGLNLYFLLGR